ncbi:Asp-tRNA(Asn)/Glu-tRNA(Gln) amidotransferase subunit GatB [Pseudoteredinibacter isoporae]|uniref:Aspartyl/glutamyl-tRNA(Asn/Gln) amidotransferase subunit B n=1 Tax=Pseudoteredinibacter isoporae TaxID=570281 RepID=A0A7X0JU16_9GAMM|nr:Asp-tRNA(Asn)/Glu-tRNA(Gln) amidotransferase subunit GatB [Pseudoteredinibacter isoporae]MBB6521396.1 aspartyl-tRNA(Asn)/glutamyl-tRNA(Gln) amidotransferase subunit B [Pseudoteredinibacter isoporae]NHO86951.1 Asp-tRNA(Asn)/Glu-tRNA(Gln) amidotransferase subunit GatB [Pseudoteredinibacter isoporae]NIB24596.1 Asp-tRNA(Asn)/Glu-tRNA(Gln) amidotransferase subunit GatB [Pseudoteredinibacter isoporae]
MQWETVIGLEVHVQLATQTKIFSGASTAFGAEPNTQACAIDLAMPGTLPVVNEQAYRYAIMFGLAIDAEIGKRSFFERKNYFYPDLPKGYQTTQLEQPIVGAGQVELNLGEGRTKTVRIHHAHLEEDAGKSLHEDFHGMSGIDLNRAGTPLIEVVTEPDMRNAEEAVAFAKKLHSIVTSLGICDGEMSQGSMRFDVNVSVRPKGEEKLGTRTETKNLNSFKFMEEAILLEVERQIDVLENGGDIVQETRLYNGDTKVARSMRSKEEANDYRYFPCPDLLPVELDDDYIDSIRADMPELPEARRERFKEDYQLSDYDADILSGDMAMANYFEAATKACNDAKLVANWVMGDLSSKLNNDELSIGQSKVNAEQLAGIISRIKDDSISSKIAKDVFEAIWNGEGDSADAVIEAKGLKQVSDTGALEQMADEVIANSQKQVDNYRNADPDKRPKMMGYFVGQIMKASKGQANPKAINEILLKKLNELL